MFRGKKDVESLNEAAFVVAEFEELS